MEIIKEKKKIPKYVEVENDEYEIITIYKTSDGKIFKDTNSYYTKNAKHLAQQHEDQLTFEKTEKMEYGLIDFGETWYKVKTQEELEAVMRRFSTWGDLSVKGEIKIGEWFTDYFDYGGDCSSDTLTVISLDTVLSSIGELLALFGKKIVDK